MGGLEAGQLLPGEVGLTCPVPQRGAGEQELLDLVAEGLTNRQIAERTGLDERAVKAYVSGMIAKFTSPRSSQPVPRPF